MRPPPRITKSLPQHTPRKRPDMDSRHLANLRLLPCVACGLGLLSQKTITQAHHLLRTEERGLSRKSSDRWAIPLCARCHQALHAAGDEEAFLAGRGIDGRATASALWAARGDLDGMTRVIYRARQAAQLSANALSVRTNA